MTDRTNKSAAEAYVSKYETELQGHDVIVVAFLGVASALDDSPSGALLSEYRQYHRLLEAARQPAESNDTKTPDADDLLSPSW